MYSLSLRSVLRDHYGVDVGDYSYGSLLWPGSADRGLTVGHYVSIGPNVRRFGAAHPLDYPCLHPLWYNPALGIALPEDDVERTETKICNGAWIGANVVVLPGCRRIGVGSVVGAGSVLTRNVEDFEVVAGNPARHIKMRLSPGVRRDLVANGHWNLPPVEAHHYLRDLISREGEDDRQSLPLA